MKSLRWLLLLAIGSLSANASMAGNWANFLPLDPPKALPPFSLEDQRGNPFNLDNLQHHWSLIYVGYTSCPDVCPVSLLKLAAVQKQLSQKLKPAAMPQVVFLAVDPKRDKLILAQYVAHFNKADIGITGQVAQIDNLVKGLEASYRIGRKLAGTDQYVVAHSSSIAVINPQTRMVAKINPPFDVDQIVSHLLQLMHPGDNHD